MTRTAGGSLFGMCSSRLATSPMPSSSTKIPGGFGAPRARAENEEGKITEWRSKALPRYRRLTTKAEALIASVHLAGTHTRRVKRALHGLFQGAVGKDVASRAWRKVKVDRDAWCARRHRSVRKMLVQPARLSDFGTGRLAT